MFQMSGKHVYLDYAASTPLDEDAKKAMEPYLGDKFYNPSAIYSPAKQVKSGLEASRQTIAENIGVKKNELVFTAGATEANNMAVFGVAGVYPKAHFIISAIEPDSILKPAERLKEQGQEITVVRPDEQGIIKPEDVAGAIRENTVLVSIIMANNEIGTIQPINLIAKILQQVRDERRKTGNKLPLYFHTDAAQATNYLDIHPKRLGVDLMSFNGSKIYGPKQIGALFVSSGAKLSPLIYGGGQERGLRSGTENTAYIAGFAQALEKTSKLRKTESKRLALLQKYFIDCLLKSFKDAKINGSLKKRLPNNIHVTFPGVDNERLIYGLDELGVYAASGSACSEASDESSHVLSAISLSREEAESSVRFSLGRQTAEDDLDYVLSCLKSLLK